MDKEYNNNLDNFLRRKQETFDEATDWDRPDKATKAAVLNQVAIGEGSSKGPGNTAYRKWIAMAAGVSLLFVLLGGYVYQLNEPKQLTKSVINETITTETIENQGIDLEGQQLEGAAFSLKEEQNQAAIQFEENRVEEMLTNEMANLNQQSNDLENQISVLEQTMAIVEKARLDIIALEKKVQNLKRKIKEENKQKEAFLERKKTESKSSNTLVKTKLTEKGEISLKPAKEMPSIAFKWQNDGLEMPQKRPSQLPLQELLLEEMHEPKEHSNFEIGYQHSLQEFKVLMKNLFAGQELKYTTLTNHKIYSQSPGVDLAYSPKKNWWIRTGLHLYKVEVSRKSRSITSYDRTTDYINEQGEYILTYTSNTPYINITRNFDVVIPEDTTLQNQDQLKLTMEEFLYLRYLQIPLGIDYFYGKGKLQVLGQVGGQWNRVSVNGYGYSGKIESTTQEGIISQGSTIIDRKELHKQFLSAYAGVGLNYEFKPNWQMRAGVNCSYRFIKSELIRENVVDYPSINVSANYKLGLHYRFK